ncbi:hypothetical protein VF04_34995 [Nostoc linckia z7]|uniref:Uncharacterized protein n=2 Tax=Nostoc linckia TaxID=92942 RepID=A0ABX4KCP6_NOSLI|nr:hypothetical protein VF05_32270 [Nostoc linckia z3]PHJ63665.1 hypothetical protein VF03_30145 [Nostoc linckia z2]PHJ73873.1 hypothetical protein VF06_35745 [Nostoc linckia z4]PHJ87186.1 hypothetical protein VF04_34995 [Nostoc linckia z7]
MSNCSTCKSLKGSKDERLIQLAEIRGKKKYANLESFLICRMINGGYTVKAPDDDVSNFVVVQRVFN